MEPRTDNLTTKCSVALLTSLLTLNLYWYPKLISCYIWKRESGIIWEENGMICSTRSTLQTIRHKFREHGHQERKTRRWKLKKGQRNNRERKSGPIAKSPLIPTFGTIRLKFLFAKIFWNWTKLLLLPLLVPHLWKKVLNRKNELFSIFHQFRFVII